MGIFVGERIDLGVEDFVVSDVHIVRAAKFAWEGKEYLDLRHYWKRKDREHPEFSASKKGICLPTPMWKKVVTYMQDSNGKVD